MAIKTKAQLKAYFQTGSKPTQAQFEDLIDSTFNDTADMFDTTILNLHTSFALSNGQAVIDIPANVLQQLNALIFTNAKLTTCIIAPIIVGRQPDTIDFSLIGSLIISDNPINELQITMCKIQMFGGSATTNSTIALMITLNSAKSAIVSCQMIFDTDTQGFDADYFSLDYVVIRKISKSVSI